MGPSALRRERGLWGPCKSTPFQPHVHMSGPRPGPSPQLHPALPGTAPGEGTRVDKEAHVPDTRYQRTVWARRGWPACGPSPFPLQRAPTTRSGCDQQGQHHLQGPGNQECVRLRECQRRHGGGIFQLLLCVRPNPTGAATTAPDPQGTMEEKGPPPAPPPSFWAPAGPVPGFSAT